MQAHKKEAGFQEASVQYTLTYREVVDILRLLKEAEHCESVELSAGELKLKFRRAPKPGQRQVQAPASAARPAPAAKEAQSPSTAVARPPAPGDAITAPMLGTFYRASEPGAAPFVEVGSQVSQGDTVGLIEVMKLFSPVVSDRAGRVVEILADNGSLVEYGQALVRIETGVS